MGHSCRESDVKPVEELQEYNNISCEPDTLKPLQDNGAVCAPVRTLHEVLADPHLCQRGMLVCTEKPN